MDLLSTRKHLKYGSCVGFISTNVFFMHFKIYWNITTTDYGERMTSIFTNIFNEFLWLLKERTGI